jgi:hypothetical protein
MSGGGSDHNLAGGGSDYPNELAKDTTNGIFGIVTGQKGNTIAGSRIILYDKNTLGENLPNIHNFNRKDSTSSDSIGGYAFAEIAAGDYAILATSKEGDLISFKDEITLSDSTKDTNDLVMLAPAIVKGSVLSDEFTIDSVALSNLPFATSVDNKGEFSFKNIPKGSYSLLTFFYTNKSEPSTVTVQIDALAGKTIELDTVSFLKPIEESVMLLDNFSDDDERIAPYPLFAGGYWYYTGENTTTIPAKLGDSQVNTAIEGEARYLHVQFDVNENSQEPYALIGFNLGRGYSYYAAGGSKDSVFYNFSKMSAFCFQAKGSGNINVKFGSKMTRDFNASWSVFTSKKTLSAQWEEICVQPSELMGQYQDQLWEKAHSEVYGISFEAKEDVDLYLDDIRVKGMTIENLFE